VWNEIGPSLESGMYAAASRAVQLAVTRGLSPRVGANLICYAADLGRHYGMINGHAGSPLSAAARGELALPAEDRQALDVALEAFVARHAAEPARADDAALALLWAKTLPQMVAEIETKNDGFSPSVIESRLGLLNLVSPLERLSGAQVDQVDQLRTRAFAETRPVTMKELVARIEAAQAKDSEER
jgi:hypothetical protein